MPFLELTLFGRFQARLDDAPMPGFRTNKVQALLVYLVAEPERHSRESLMDLLWPGMPERSARHNLRQVLYYLRRAIPELGSSQDGGNTKVPLLLTNRHQIQINAEAALSADVVQFEALIDGAQAHDHLDLLTCQACRSDLEKAIGFYQGDFLAEFYL
jgi:DNA-binding SARP family transcriptional activator